MFTIIKRLDKFTIKGYTVHALKDRGERLALLNKDKGACIGIYLIDKRHGNGLEVHIVYGTARVRVCNANTGLVCTGLFLAPKHLKRYDLDNASMRAWAQYNEKMGYNYL